MSKERTPNRDYPNEFKLELAKLTESVAVKLPF
jgi:hypothetical protein